MNYNEIRRKTAAIRVGSLTVGGWAPIAVQSMTNTDPHDFAGTLAQMQALKKAGCDIVRMTVPDAAAAETRFSLKEADPGMPLVADIHFDYRLAVLCAERGADKIRINPGNIGSRENVRAVCRACRERKIPIRIGVNGGSLEKEILAKYGAPTPEALLESALYHIRLLTDFDFTDIIVSIKASEVATMIAANRMLAERCPFPLHLGVTEAGGRERGRIKSAIGIGALLAQGIGDTVRVSLTEDPVAEIAAAKEILNSLSIQGQRGMDIVSCPTCGRTKIDLIELSARFEEAAKAENLLDFPIRVALMGCPVNGPGEAGNADIGICGGNGEALMISHGKILSKIPEDEIIPRLIAAVKEMKAKEEKNGGQNAD